MTQRILVWDLPTRIFHWTLALSFAGAYLTAESERWRDIHVLLGYAMLGLIAFRLVWGFVGSRYVRFGLMVRCSAFVTSYFAELFRGEAWHPVGYNPAGVIVILLLLLLGIVSCVSGWAVYEEMGGDWLEDLHNYISYAMLAVVFVHIAGVLVVSYLQRENLIVAMITGKKRREETCQAISSSYPLVAMLLLTALIGFLILDWPDARDETWFRAMGQGFMEFLHSALITPIPANN
jgi:cytochrome b